MPHVEMIGTVVGSPYYHHHAKEAPLWAACMGRMFNKRVPADEAEKLEKRGLRPCPRCFKEANDEAASDDRV